MANGNSEVELNSDKLNRWLTLTANVGVLVGLVVLIFEVQQNRHLVRAELGSGATTIMRELQQELANNPEISAIVAKASLGQEPLTDSELIRLDAHYEARQSWLEIEDTVSGSSIKMPNVPFRILGSEGRVRFPGLPLGAANEVIYQDLLGYTQEQIEKLRETGAI